MWWIWRRRWRSGKVFRGCKGIKRRRRTMFEDWDLI